MSAVISKDTICVDCGNGQHETLSSYVSCQCPCHSADVVPPEREESVLSIRTERLAHAIAEADRAASALRLEAERHQSHHVALQSYEIGRSLTDAGRRASRLAKREL